MENKKYYIINGNNLFTDEITNNEYIIKFLNTDINTSAGIYFEIPSYLKTEIKHIQRDEILEKFSKCDLYPFFNLIVEKCNEINDYKIIENFDIDKIWPTYCHEHRLPFLELIDSDDDCERCYNKSQNLKEPNSKSKRRKEWFQEYHKLFYSIKDKGFDAKISTLKVNSPHKYPSVIKFTDNVYYRIDGTHRSSVMKYLGYNNITVKVYDFDYIRNKIPELNNYYESFLLNTKKQYYPVQKYIFSFKAKINKNNSDLKLKIFTGLKWIELDKKITTEYQLFKVEDIFDFNKTSTYRIGFVNYNIKDELYINEPTIVLSSTIKKKIYTFGSCRVSLRDYSNHIFTSFLNFTYTTKEVLQAIDMLNKKKDYSNFFTNKMSATSSVEENKTLIDKKLYDGLCSLHDSDIILIELSSVNQYYDNNYYYSKNDIIQNNIDLTKIKMEHRKLTEDEIIEDINYIMNIIKKPIIFIGHINVKHLDKLNLKRQIPNDLLNDNGQLKSRVYIDTIIKNNCKNYIIINELCDIPELLLQKEESGFLNYNHLSEFGKKLLNQEIENIMCNKI